MAILSQPARDFLARQRVGRLATADRQGAPHVVPVCYAVADDTLYITIDEKPKRAAAEGASAKPAAAEGASALKHARPLKRLANIAENPAVAVVVDRWDEDWTRLGWVMLRGAAEILADGAEHDAAQALLVARYPQYAAMRLADLPVIAVRIARATSWGDLADRSVL
ncbi:MAG TPA: pyridoxamine 5'-phosphate oxidase family protein [Candidatus Sulfotelmatobacter sp.]|nr:pyridoxamine 5'-phosphate oxidase family protein [Candidatus Sulfotelmatobacter sp.]